jgi:hypothetical protein
VELCACSAVYSDRRCHILRGNQLIVIVGGIVLLFSNLECLRVELWCACSLVYND